MDLDESYRWDAAQPQQVSDELEVERISWTSDREVVHAEELELGVRCP